MNRKTWEHSGERERTGAVTLCPKSCGHQDVCEPEYPTLRLGSGVCPQGFVHHQSAGQFGRQFIETGSWLKVRVTSVSSEVWLRIWSRAKYFPLAGLRHTRKWPQGTCYWAPECLKAFDTVNITPSTMGCGVSTHSEEMIQLLGYAYRHLQCFFSLYFSPLGTEWFFFILYTSVCHKLIFFLKCTALERTFKSNNASKNT